MNGAQETIPALSLDLDWLPAVDRGEAWRRTVGQGFEVYDLPHALSARVRAWDLGQALLTDVDHPHQTFVRDEPRTRQDGEEHVRISVEFDAPALLAIGDREVPVATRQAHLFDMAQPMTKVVGAGRVLCMALAREVLEAVLPGVDLHGVTLGPSGVLVAEHLRALPRGLDAAQVAPGPLTTATAHLIAACLSPTADRIEAARPVLTGALLHRARRYIRARCGDPTLSPDDVARGVGVSRATLYRAFETQGGVADYIRRARLEAARAALANPADPRRIGEIAFAFGFGSEAQFSRAFRAAFGAAPSEFRRGPGSATGSHPNGSAEGASRHLDRYWFIGRNAAA